MIRKKTAVRLLQEKIKKILDMGIPKESINSYVGIYPTEKLNNIMKGRSSALEKECEFLNKENIIDAYLKIVSKVHVGDEFLLKLTLASALTPWLNTDTVNLHILGKSTGGKTHALGSVLKTVIPESHYVTITSNSDKAIYYAAKKGAANKNLIIMMDDFAAYDSFIQKLKGFTWAGTIKPKHWTVSGGKFEEFNITKNYSFWLTSVLPPNNIELQNRFLYMNVDETNAHTNMVYKHIIDTYINGIEKRPIDKEKIFFYKNTFNLLTLENSSVIIPFEISFKPQSDWRALIHFICLIKGITGLYKYQRQKVGDNIIVANLGDCLLARDIMLKVSTQKLSQSLLDMWKLLKTDSGKTKYELANELNVSVRTVLRRIKQLSERGFIKFGYKNKMATYAKSEKKLDKKIEIGKLRDDIGVDEKLAYDKKHYENTYK